VTLCEFCVHQSVAALCAVGRSVPKKMRCEEFTPSIERFCATPEDYRDQQQLREMALYFGIAGKELKRVLALGEKKAKKSRE
jgi:hypothetical protein